MSKTSTLSQAAGILTLLDEQKLDLDQVQTIRPYLVALARGAKNCRLPDIKTFRAVVEDQVRIILRYLVEFDKHPSIPDGLKILPDSKQLPNRTMGVIEFDPTRVELYLDESQNGRKVFNGYNLKRSLEYVPVYGAQLLDFYMLHPYFIPEEWKKDEKGNTRYISFWGTIYCRDNSLCVRSLYWSDGSWRCTYHWLSGDWSWGIHTARHVI